MTDSTPEEPIKKRSRLKKVDIDPQLDQESGELITTRSASYEGPLPPPSIFREYGLIVADAPERILSIFEKDSNHVREIEMAALNAQKDDNRRIHWMAYSLVMAGFLLSVIFAYMDKELLAAAILTTTIGAILYSFLSKDKPKENISGD